MNTKIAATAGAWLTTMTLSLLARLTSTADPAESGEEHDRGDVPGWVMITVETAPIPSKRGLPRRLQAW
jgi:hypothetical protein